MNRMNLDLLVYVAHALFWGSFGLTRWLIQRSANRLPSGGADPAASKSHTAPYSRALLVIHALAFGTMYFGLAAAVLPNQVPVLFLGQRVVATLIIALGAWLTCWALLYFGSWRFRAKLDEGHQLATGGPFKFVRHPIYMGLNLLALGTTLWVPTPILWASLLLMLIGGDLRARAEEKLLARVFGTTYSEYCKNTSRFLPGIY
jgi:protein-S-isoprenylcysteine O-methyltransferase Ste14